MYAKLAGNIRKEDKLEKCAVHCNKNCFFYVLVIHRNCLLFFLSLRSCIRRSSKFKCRIKEKLRII